MITCSKGSLEPSRQSSAAARRIRDVVFLSLAAALVTVIGVAKADAAPSVFADRNRIPLDSPVRPFFAGSTGGRLSEVHKPRCRFLLADKIETRDQIEYTTDPETARASENARRRELEKEERSWKMLDDMQIYQFPREKSQRRSNENRRQ